MEGEAGPSLQNAVTNRDTCAVCQGFGEEGHPRWRVRRNGWSYSWEDIYIHYPNVVVLDQSARNGCQVCSYLVQDFKRDDRFASEWEKASELERTRVGSFDIDRDTAEVGRLEKGYRLDSGISTSRIVFKVHHRVPRTRRTNYHMKLGDTVIHQLGTRGPSVRNYLWSVRADPIDPDPPTLDLLSDAHTRLVHRWMKNCDEEHEKCRLALGQSQKLPKRLLEITSNPATGEITKIRLIETTPSSKGRYACLSYCWGRSAQDYKTTRSNLLQYLESIPFNSLPGTISDTLQLCCKLGFRYVWIDSLCIIQGDKEDWEREASNMAGIYSSSNLTLATHLCEDSSESFLQRRQQLNYRFLGKDIARIAYTEKHTEEKRLIYMTKIFSSYKGLDLSPGRDPWLDRAWTFQEWVLSPRVLHIQQITQWECLEGRSDEIQRRFPEERIPELEDTVPSSPSLLDKDWSWSDIVEEFTRRKIGKDEDRLPALAGLAKKYRDATGYEYLAGVWRQELPAALLWEKKGWNYLKSPAGFRAPSWSWASLEGEIRVPFDSTELELDAPYFSISSVISAECSYWPPDTLSTVKSAWLDIKGPMSLVTKRTIDQDDIVCLCNDVDGDHDRSWAVNLDQDTCSTEDLAQSKIYLLLIGERWALVLEKMGQSGGKDTFKRRGRAYTGNPVKDLADDAHWEKKLIRLV